MGTLSPDADYANYIKEFNDGFGELKEGSGCVLEVGCGVSPYAEMFTRKGYQYTGCDTSRFACQWMRKAHQVQVHFGDLKTLMGQQKFDIVLSAHVLEHAVNAPNMVQQMSARMAADATLYLLVPEGTDLWNQDHNWFFSEESVTELLIRHGIVVTSIKTLSIVKRERFIYIVGKKV